MSWNVDVNGTTIEILARDSYRNLMHKIHVRTARDNHLFESRPRHIEIRQIAISTVSISFDGYVVDGNIIETHPLELSDNDTRGSMPIDATAFGTDPLARGPLVCRDVLEPNQTYCTRTAITPIAIGEPVRNTTSGVLGIYLGDNRVLLHGSVTGPRVEAEFNPSQWGPVPDNTGLSPEDFGRVQAISANEMREYLNQMAYDTDVVAVATRRFTGLEPADQEITPSQLKFVQSLEEKYGEMKCACCEDHIHFPENILKKLGQKETEAYLEFCKKNNQTPEIFCCKCFKIAENTPKFMNAYLSTFASLRDAQIYKAKMAQDSEVVAEQAREYAKQLLELKKKQDAIDELIAMALNNPAAIALFEKLKAK